MIEAEALARIIWQDPTSGEQREYVLCEGATATIGRSSNNDIQIAEQHVSRQHAVITYRDGIFLVTDLASSNGTFVNDEPVGSAFPLFAGDRLRLYVPELEFMAVDEAAVRLAEQTGRLLVPAINDDNCTLTITNGPQEGQVVTLLLNEVHIGRATTAADWDILLQDPSVSRPHARLTRESSGWVIYDLNSSNGTSVNGETVTGAKGYSLHDGDAIMLGSSVLLFRRGGAVQNSLDMIPPTQPHES